MSSDGLRPERRRRSDDGRTPMEVLQQLPTTVVLDRLPVAALAFDNTGVILHANMAFAYLLGYSLDEVFALSTRDIFLDVQEGGSALSGAEAHTERLVELRHADGSIMQAVMSESLLVRGDDPVTLSTFLEATERLWDLSQKLWEHPID